MQVFTERCQVKIKGTRCWTRNQQKTGPLSRILSSIGVFTGSVDRLCLGKGVQGQETKEVEKAQDKKRKVKPPAAGKGGGGRLGRRRWLPIWGTEMFLQGCQS